MRRGFCQFLLFAAVIAPGAWLAEAAEPPAGSSSINRLFGAGINVSDIDRSIDFYTKVIGLKIAFSTPARNGMREVALSLSGSLTDGTVLVLAWHDGTPLQPGHETFGRIITNAVSAKAVGERAKAMGYDVKEIGGGHTIFLTDPDGYGVEVYQPGAETPK
jgi:lactoylglutathione lyase